jgi:P27 family predicted phage terminase small subunit
MGARGPRPTPTKILQVRGSWRANGRASEPRPRIGKPKCPAWLDAAAKAKWRTLARELSAIGLLTVIDGDALAVYCQAWAEFQLATETLQREGRTIKAGDAGYRAPHPAVAQQRSAWKAIKEFAALFGLDPADRGRLTVPDPPEEPDALDELIAGRPLGAKRIGRIMTRDRTRDFAPDSIQTTDGEQAIR